MLDVGRRHDLHEEIGQPHPAPHCVADRFVRPGQFVGHVAERIQLFAAIAGAQQRGCDAAEIECFELAHRGVEQSLVATWEP